MNGSVTHYYLTSFKTSELVPLFDVYLFVSWIVYIIDKFPILTQPQIWFSLGCASMATGQLELAQTALQRFVSIEPDVIINTDVLVVSHFNNTTAI